MSNTIMSLAARETCTLLAVLCGNGNGNGNGNSESERRQILYPFLEIASAGRMEVHKLVNPTLDQFKEAQRSVRPIILFCQGEGEPTSLIWGLASLIDPPLPTIVYLEVPNGDKIAQNVHSKGVPYVIYWNNQFLSYSASHFSEALVSVVQSSLSHTWDAFQLADASFRLYCTKTNCMSQRDDSVKLGPRLLGVAPNIYISAPPEPNNAETEEEDEEGDSSGATPAITIYEEDVDVRLLICGLSCGQDAFLLGSLEDGLSALLNVEVDTWKQASEPIKCISTS